MPGTGSRVAVFTLFIVTQKYKNTKEKKKKRRKEKKTVRNDEQTFASLRIFPREKHEAEEISRGKRGEREQRTRVRISFIHIDRATNLIQT